MNASSVDSTQLAGVSNVALASLQVALVQQAQFKQTLEEMALRRDEERAAESAAKANKVVQNTAPGGTRAIEKSNKGARSGTNSGDTASRRSRQPAASTTTTTTTASKAGGGGSVNIRV